jgi:hypothetical protein
VTYYVPGLGEKDPDKTIRSLMQVHENTATNATDITALQTAAAGYVVGPASATDNGFVKYDGTTGKLVKDHAATIALASEVTGTLPVANGGTNYTGGAWTTFAPTPTPGAGAFTTVSAAGAFLTIGKLVHFCLTITITAVGTASGAITCALPTGTTARASMLPVGETAVAGTSGVARIASGATTMLIVRYDAGSLIGNGHVLSMGGIYEIT